MFKTVTVIVLIAALAFAAPHRKATTVMDTR